VEAVETRRHEAADAPSNGDDRTSIAQVADAIDRLDEEAIKLVAQALAAGEDPLALIESGIVTGVRKCGDKLAAYEYGVPELLVAGEIAQECVKVVRPYLDPARAASKATVVLASVQGDIHELGKNLVALLLELAGFSVVDLGVDVPPMAIIDAAEQRSASVIALSSLMVTTMAAQREVITYLRDTGKRDRFRVVIGGAPTTQEWAESIGADGWAPDAHAAVKLVERLCAAEAQR
jgi:methylmalonyl-CoA mutase cobalamin-binding domain/chain